MNTYDLVELDEDLAEEPMDTEEEDVADEAYDSEEVDEMLDELVEEAGEEEDFAERVRRRLPMRAGRGRPVTAALGRPAYRAPAQTGGFVTQKQLQDALGRVGGDVRRNAQGIKTVNTRVNGIVEVNKVQSRAIGRLDKTMKIDGALELVEAYNGTSINAYQLLKGAVKSGYLGQGKGPLANPVVIGGIGFVLRNPGFLGGLGLPNPVP